MGLIYGLVYWSSQPPALQSVDDPQSPVFNGAGALEVLEELIGDGLPHPAGSPQNRIVRDRIIQILARHGYEAEVQRDFACSSLYPSCSPVENIIARFEGREDGPGLFFLAHYDSQVAGPGAGDDMSAVSVMLVLAELLKDRPQPLNDIVFVFSDSEENGLLGAEAFVKRHPLAERIGLIMNMEARGSSGRANLFESSLNNAGLISAFGEVARYPAGNSLFHAVYQRMPNNTDYTVFRERGIPGLNFAFSEAHAHYHSVLDDIAHLDRRSLQHQGQNALDVLNGFGDRPLPVVSEEDAVYFGLLSLWLVTWPMSWSWGLLLLSAGLMAYVVWAGLRRGELSFSGLAIGSGYWAVLGAVTLIVSGAAGLLLGFTGATHGLDHAAPIVPRLMLLALVLAIALWAARFLTRGSSPLEIGLAGAGAWFLFSVLLQIYLPGGVFLFLLPALAFAGAMAMRMAVGVGRLQIWLLLPLAVSASFAIDQSFALETVANFDFAFVLAAPLVLLVVALVPVLQAGEAPVSLTAVRITSLAAAALLAGSMLMPSVSERRPAGMNLIHYQQEDAPSAHWLAMETDYFPGAADAYSAFQPAPDWSYPWGAPRRSLRYRHVEVDPADLSPTGIDLLREAGTGAGRRLDLRITPADDVLSVDLYVPADRVSAVAANDRDVVLTVRGNRAGEMVRLGLNGLFGTPVDVSLDTTGAEPFSLHIVSVRMGLPDAASGLIAQRSPLTAPVHIGDHTIFGQIRTY